MELEAVIGLEVHAQLLTESKIFCGCSTAFGAPANSSTCPVCLGLPGALPVLNRQAVAMAAKAALALGCEVNASSTFARKNYFYPDLPKGYQISQYDKPLAVRGHVSLLTARREGSGKALEYRKECFRIHRLHLEEDAGKSIHAGDGSTYVNLNRTGVPLIEIVSEPDFRNSQQAVDYLAYLRQTLIYLGVCDGNMEEGSLRCDANVSVRSRGALEFGTKTEIKNLNSFRFLQKALDYEIQRQGRVLQSGGSVKQETLLWDEEEGKTLPMRSKEEAHDYRYFPEPDLLPVIVPADWLEELRGEIPELPEEKRDRLAKAYDLTPEETGWLVQSRIRADFFEEACRACEDPRSVYNWMAGDLIRLLKKDNLDLSAARLSAGALARLIELINSGAISGKIAKDVFQQVYESGRDPDSIVSEQGLQQISDSRQLEAVVERILNAHPDKVRAFREGKQGLIGFFVGQVMRETRGQANPQIVNELLKSRLQDDA